MVFIGLFFAAIALFYGIPNIQTEYASYFQRESFFLVIFGTFAATILSITFKDFKNLSKIFYRKVLFGFTDTRFMEPYQVVKVLVELSELSQVATKQELVKKSKGIGDGFLSRGLSMIAAGLDKEFIKTALKTDILAIDRRHLRMIRIIRNMASFAPMFGMVGTVMGVVQVLKNVTDIDNIVVGMSLALLTTLYGLISAAILFIPLANRLRAISTREQLSKEIMMEGILAIHDREIPLKVEKYLSSYMSSNARNDEA